MEIVIGKVVALSANQSACNRTKNRVANHGSQGFEIKRFNPGSQLFGGAAAILFESVSNSGKGGESWFGWLPIDEIVLSEV